MIEFSSMRMWLMFVLLVGLGAGTGRAADDPPAPARDPQIGRSFRVPYHLTDTNHFLVRCRINGKGPFNFLVDSGAPALYVTVETAAKLGLKTPKGDFWAPVDRLEFEGGARLDKVKARVEDPFQLVGMNALGLPGATIDGILGFTILARFRLEIDPTRDRMTWTKLAFDPPDPPTPRDEADRKEHPPLEFQVMNLLGPLAKALAAVVGKPPEVQRTPRGFFGIEWEDRPGGGRKAEDGAIAAAVRVSRILDGSPAARAGLQAGDELVSLKGKPLKGVKEARGLVAAIRPGETVELVIRRPRDAGTPKPAERTINLIAGEGL